MADIIDSNARGDQKAAAAKLPVGGTKEGLTAKVAQPVAKMAVVRSWFVVMELLQ